MSQTLNNGIVVPINSDAYQLTADLATMGNSTNLTKTTLITPGTATGATVTGTIASSTTGSVTWIDLNLQFTYTGNTALNTDYTSLGTPVPAAARSTTAPTFYGACWMSGGTTAAFNTAANVFYNPAQGLVEIRLQSGTATTSSGVVFNLNHRYML